VYGTTGRPDLAKKLGFQAAKFPLPYGPGVLWATTVSCCISQTWLRLYSGDGDAGMKKNIECIKAVRSSWHVLFSALLCLTSGFSHLLPTGSRKCWQRLSNHGTPNPIPSHGVAVFVSVVLLIWLRDQIDCYMSLTVPYAIELARRVRT